MEPKPPPQSTVFNPPINGTALTAPYIGRFAPSPSGPLHQGSLIAALASFLDAKTNKGSWFVRMEDLDPPRESPEAASEILNTLEKLHLFWDGPVLYQSQRHQAYEAALEKLEQAQLTFPCTCSRQDVQHSGGIHNGVCEAKPQEAFSVRYRCPKHSFSFNDLIQGQQNQDLARDVGDFIIKRKDNFYAYQLAVVVDDAFQGINHVIRGIDLMDSTGKQMCLQTALQLPKVQYGHIAVIVNDQGQKLSKQHFAQAVDLNEPKKLLLSALGYLQQSPSPELKDASIDEILNWATEHWHLKSLAGIKKLPETVASTLPGV